MDRSHFRWPYRSAYGTGSPKTSGALPEADLLAQARGGGSRNRQPWSAPRDSKHPGVSARTEQSCERERRNGKDVDLPQPPGCFESRGKRSTLTVLRPTLPGGDFLDPPPRARQCFASPMSLSRCGLARWLAAFQRITRYIAPERNNPKSTITEWMRMS